MTGRERMLWEYKEVIYVKGWLMTQEAAAPLLRAQRTGNKKAHCSVCRCVAYKRAALVRPADHLKPLTAKVKRRHHPWVGGWQAGGVPSLSPRWMFSSLFQNLHLLGGEYGGEYIRGIEILRHGNDEFAGQTLLWAKLFPVEMIKTESVHVPKMKYY